jgi:CHAT domain-containing protein
LNRARKGNKAKELYDAATSFQNRAEYEQGIKNAQEAVALYREIDDKEGEMWALFTMGWCSAGLFRHNQALQYYTQAGEITDLLGDEGKRAHYVSGIGDYYWNIGDFEHALQYKREAQILYYNNIDLINEAWALSAIGSLVGSLGDFDEMIVSYKQALRIHENALNYIGESSVLSNIGWAYKSDGDYSEALDYHTRALTVALQYSDRWREMNAYHGIGNIYEELGDTVNAYKYATYYLEAATAIGSKTDRANALNNLGLLCLLLTREYDRARSYFNESQTLAQQIGYELGEAVAMANNAVVMSKQGKHTEAIPIHEEALRRVRALNAREQEMQGLNELGDTYFSLGEYEDALSCHLAAIEIAQSIGVKNERWMYELNAGKEYIALGNQEKGLEYYKKAASTLLEIKSKIKSENLQKGFSDMEKQIEVYKRLIDLLIEMGRPEEAIQYIEESKSKMVRDAFGDVKPQTDDQELEATLAEVDKIERKKNAIEKTLHEEKMKPEAEQDKVKIDRLAKTLATTEGEFNQWMLRLRTQNRQMYDALTINPASLGDIQSDIPDKTVLVEYFVSSDQLYVFCIASNYFVAKAVNVSEDELNGLVDYFVGLIKSRSSDAREEMYRTATTLYTYLIEPVEEEIETFDNIVIVPFGVLHYLPFHSLVRESDGARQYVIEWKRISYTTSATFADILKSKTTEGGSLGAWANPDGSLPGASEEVKAVKAEVFRNDAVIWTYTDATKEGFFANAKDYDILHLATHGMLRSNPLESYLLFAGDTEDDQRLTLLEVAGYTALRDRTDLVFLSACQTAAEKGRTTGSELISLAEAFAMAGSPTLIATLWKVADESTSHLVLSFYQKLIYNKEDKLEALRGAQLSLLESDRFSHPFYWAPFVLIGSWQ